MTPLKAIKEFCYQCSGENRAEVTRCTAPKCPLYPYRKGHNPNKREMTDEQREAAAKRLKEAREANRRTTDG